MGPKEHRIIKIREMLNLIMENTPYSHRDICDYLDLKLSLDDEVSVAIWNERKEAVLEELCMQVGYLGGG